MVAGLVVTCLFLAPGAAASTQTISPLPESNYTVRPACVSPEPGHAGCLALELRPRTSAAKSHKRPLGITRRIVTTAGEAVKVCESSGPAEGCYGLRPEDLKDAYFHGESPESPVNSPLQTVALIDAYNDYGAEADLKVYDREFGLPELASCTSGQVSDCFEQVNQKGERITLYNSPFPSDEEQLIQTEESCTSGKEKTRKSREACEEALESDGWAIETSTDIEVARGICQNCRIILVEADSSSYQDLEEAEQSAVSLGATEVSNSWSGKEPTTDSAAFNHPGVMITASAGDSGYLNWTEAQEAKEAEESYYAGAGYPASSPHVIAVGGTKLTLESGARKSETVWNEDPDPEGGNEGAGGGGCSSIFEAPSWQREVSDWSQVGCESRRAVADVAADADPYTGVAVYDSLPDLTVSENGRGELQFSRTPLHWWPIGGTSVASPIVASLGALAGGAQELAYPAKTLYAHLAAASKPGGTSYLFDVTEGGNGECNGVYDLGCSGSMTSLLDCGEGKLICNAGPGYDGPTGVGAPNGLEAFRRLPPSPAAEEEEKLREEREERFGETQRHAEDARIELEHHEREREEEQERKEREQQQIEAQRKEELRKEEEVHKAEVLREEQQRSEERRHAEESAQSGQGTSTEGGNPGSAGSSPASPTPKSQITKPKLLALALTRKAAAAARSATVLVSRLSFTFELNAPAKLHATLAQRVRAGKREVWRKLPCSTSFSAPKGRSTYSLLAHRKLAAGRYRLTLSLAHGSRSIVFNVG